MNKKQHWHIDYLRQHGVVVGVKVYRTTQRLECRLNAKVAKAFMTTIRRFGSSDCRCVGHLHYSTTNPLSEAVLNELDSLALSHGSTVSSPDGP